MGASQKRDTPLIDVDETWQQHIDWYVLVLFGGAVCVEKVMCHHQMIVFNVLKMVTLYRLSRIVWFHNHMVSFLFVLIGCHWAVVPQLLSVAQQSVNETWYMVNFRTVVFTNKRVCTRPILLPDMMVLKDIVLVDLNCKSVYCKITKQYFSAN